MVHVWSETEFPKYHNNNNTSNQTALTGFQWLGYYIPSTHLA